MIMSIDFHQLSRIPAVLNFIHQFDIKNSSVTFIISLFSSQIMSNVPASIFMSKFSNDWFAIAYGVNVGGNSFVIGSLANIIALRYTTKEKFG